MEDGTLEMSRIGSSTLQTDRATEQRHETSEISFTSSRSSTRNDSLDVSGGSDTIWIQPHRYPTRYQKRKINA